MAPERSWTWPPWPFPLVLVVMAIVQVGGTFGAHENQPEARAIDAIAIVLLLAGPALIGCLWRWPVATVWLVIAATVLYIGRGYPYGPVVLSPTLALVRTVVVGRRVAAWIAAAAGVVGALVAHQIGAPDEGPGWSGVIGVTTWVAIVLVLGEVIRERADRRAASAAAAGEQARRQASDERLRVAQELHDVLAHNISLISVQAGVGLHLMDVDPEQARGALTAIKRASKEALGELGSVLELLRSESGAPRAPTGGLDQLDALVAGVRTPQLDVVIERSGGPRPLGPAVDLAAYRIVQESLTNVVRHASSATRAIVRVTFGDDEMIVQVDDDGRAGVASPLPGGGNGLPGMRERAAALGGSFEAGPRPGGGFRIRARLPVGTST